MTTSTPETALIASVVWTGESDKGRVFHHNELSDADRVRQHGSASFYIPNPITAGQPVDVVFSVSAGEMQLTPGSRIRIAWRWPFDWADLQQDDPSTPNHLSVDTPPNVSIATRYEHRGDLNPWHHDVDLRIVSGTLTPDDQVVVRCHAWHAPTFVTDDGYFLVLVCPDGTNDWIRLPDPPRFSVAPGPPDRFIAIAPADGFVGEKALIRVRAVDTWENPTPIEAPHLSCSGAKIDPPRACPRYPVWEYPIEWSYSGVHRFSVLGDGFSCTSNPTQVTPEKPGQRIFWGDLHAGQSEIGCGAGSLDHHYAYARDVAGLQFASQQANDHYVTKAIWKHVRHVTQKHNKEGEFLAYLGCEWSPYTKDGGDRNVIYLTDEPRMRRSGRFFHETESDPIPDLTRAPEFLEAFKSEDVLLNLHVGGRPTNLEWHAPEIEPMFEIHSTHATSEWFVFDAIRRGYKVGITAGTDGVMGRPGACGSGRRVTRNLRNGLTAVRAASLAQRSVADGFSARNCYGTSGARILLDVTIDDQPMGSEVESAGPLSIKVACEGTAGIERIDLFRDTEIIESRIQYSPDPTTLRMLFGGAKDEGTAADQRQIWDGTMEISAGRILECIPVGFQCPLNSVIAVDNRAEWSLSTAGNDMGFTFTIDGNASSRVDVNTEPCAFSTLVGEIHQGTRVFEVEGVNRRIELGPAPCEAPIFVSESFEDLDPVSGTHAYWIRVTQIDRHRAWSSPIYVSNT